MLRGEPTNWICTNRDCGMTAACDEAERDMEWRVCDCGSLMKKVAQAMVFSYLNFLWEETSSETGEKAEKEEARCER